MAPPSASKRDGSFFPRFATSWILRWVQPDLTLAFPGPLPKCTLLDGSKSEIVEIMRYLHVDVFTDRALEGNQLAVFPEPGGLSTAMMQAITREMNFSECTFIFPPERGGNVKMRIFTPGEELPMAGHPTVGSTFALAAEGAIARGRTDWVFELGVGPIPVSLEWNGDNLSFVWMTQLRPTFGGTITDTRGLAPAVGVAAADVRSDVPVQVVSCGVPFLFVPLSTRTAVDAVAVDAKALGRCCRDAGIDDRARALPTFF